MHSLKQSNMKEELQLRDELSEDGWITHSNANFMIGTDILPIADFDNSAELVNTYFGGEVWCKCITKGVNCYIYTMYGTTFPLVEYNDPDPFYEVKMVDGELNIKLKTK